MFSILKNKNIFLLLFLSNLILILVLSSCSQKTDNKNLATFDGGSTNITEYLEYFLSSTKYKPDVMPDEEGLEKNVSLLTLEKMILKEAIKQGIEKDSLYIESFKNNKRKTLFFKYMRNEIINSVINDSLIKVYYNAFSPQYNLKYIVRPVKPSASQQYTKTQKDTINLAYDELLAGNTFESVAKKYSQDITTNQRGGSLGFVTRESLGDATLRSVMDTLKQSNFSVPIKGYEAFYILLKGESRKVQVPSFEDAQGKIWQSLYRSRRHDVQFYLDKVFKRLSENYHFVVMEEKIDGVLKKTGFNESRIITSLLDFDVLTEQDMGKKLATYDGGDIKLYELFEEKNRKPDNKYEFIEQFDRIAERHILAKHAEELGYSNEPEYKTKMKDVRVSLLRSFFHRKEVVEKAREIVLVANQKGEQTEQFQEAAEQRQLKEQLEKNIKEKYNFSYVKANFKQALKIAKEKKIIQNQEQEAKKKKTE
jgi:hypothetical protein